MSSKFGLDYYSLFVKLFLLYSKIDFLSETEGSVPFLKFECRYFSLFIKEFNKTGTTTSFFNSFGVTLLSLEMLDL